MANAATSHELQALGYPDAAKVLGVRQFTIYKEKKN